MNPAPKGRFKWEPAALMALLIGIGFWLVMNPSGNKAHPRKDSLTSEIRIGDTRGVVEVTGDSPESQKFRVLTREGFESPELSRPEFEAVFGAAVATQVADGRANFLFRFLNITSWASLVWIAIGFGGQLMFSGRMFLQWLISERHKVSIITPAFWWFSLLGGICLFTYFVWRQDAVGVLGQSSGIVIYARNLRLIAKQKRREAAASQTTATEADSSPDEPERSRAGSLS
ncbi:MAG: lipid-A-disaccharide synthase N-terminal domain-containing protein [Phycisphaeraceae bacterium]|nr:lipid-A-disaccharide synthase N-terminal domain-containing protein [Phycisphaeraceae bacterium]